MKSSIAAYVLLIASATAIPSLHNIHQHHHAHKRDVADVTVTKYVEATQTAYATKYVYPDGSPVTSTPAVQPQAASNEAPAPEPSSADASVNHIPPPQATHYSAPVPVAPAPTAPKAPSVAPPAPPASHAPVSTPVPPPAPPKAAYTPPAAPAAPKPAPPAPKPAPAAPIPKAPAPASSGTFTGQMTYYAVGLGSCGLTSSPSDHIVAIPVSQMNNPANPNANPLCGQHVTIQYGGKTATAKIVDTCMGCSYGDLDMSTSLFSYFAPMSEGRVGGMTWSFDG